MAQGIETTQDTPINPKVDSANNLLKKTVWTRLHFIWAMAWAAVITIPSAIAQIIGHQFSPTARTFRRVGGFWARAILFMGGFRLRVHQRTQLNPDQPYVYVSNHQNSIDIIAHLAGIPLPFGFAAKASLKKIPFLGWSMQQSVCIWVDRSSPRRAVQTIKEAGERIRGGNSVLIYPEGERTWSHEMVPFLKGAFQLAMAAGVPLVPITILDAYQLYDERSYHSRPGRAHMIIGEPIEIEGKSRRDLPEVMEQVRAVIQKELDQGWNVNLPEAGT